MRWIALGLLYASCTKETTIKSTGRCPARDKVCKLDYFPLKQGRTPSGGGKE